MDFSNAIDAMERVGLPAFSTKFQLIRPLVQFRERAICVVGHGVLVSLNPFWYLGRSSSGGWGRGRGRMQPYK